MRSTCPSKLCCTLEFRPAAAVQVLLASACFCTLFEPIVQFAHTRACLSIPVWVSICVPHLYCWAMLEHRAAAGKGYDRAAAEGMGKVLSFPASSCMKGPPATASHHKPAAASNKALRTADTLGISVAIRLHHAAWTSQHGWRGAGGHLGQWCCWRQSSLEP